MPTEWLTPIADRNFKRDYSVTKGIRDWIFRGIESPADWLWDLLSGRRQ
jgi:hypothetical protein